MRLRHLWNIPAILLLLPALALGAISMGLLSLAMWCEEKSQLPEPPPVPAPPIFYK